MSMEDRANGMSTDKEPWANVQESIAAHARWSKAMQEATTPLYSYISLVDGKSLRVDIYWNGIEPVMKWSTHDPA